jgi:hypothetical protein
MARVKKKTEVATIKLTSQCRVAWEAAAAAETRSLANMFEVAILDYCRRHDVQVPALTEDATPRESAAEKRSPKNQQEG